VKQRKSFLNCAARGFALGLVALLLLIGAYKLLTQPAERSASIELGDTGKRLTFSVIWGWGMEQKLVISTGSSDLFETEKEEVWKKPYNAGGPIYRDASGRTFFVFLYSGIFRVDTVSNRIEKLCDRNLVSGLAHIGNFYVDMESPQATRGKDVAFSNAPEFKKEQPDDFSPCG
jgi:hypothetical protein